jgi:glycosyltransferase involved in cell wall biosynthesis
VHILFLTDNFPPEVNAPASRTFEHCQAWAAKGHRITVVTCAPNFPKGAVYAGYRNRLWQRERMGELEVIRVWSYITANEGFVKRILDYQSYMVMATLASALVRDVDVVVGTSPQFFTACAAWAVGAYKRVPYVFELRDLWPESIKAVGAMGDSWVIGWLERLELFLYDRAARVVSVTHSFRRNLVARGVDGGKVEVVTNGVDLSRFRPQGKDAALVEELGLAGKWVAGYIGTHGMAHGLETILEAAETIRRQPGGEAFRFLLLGDGARKAELVRRAGEMELDNVIFLDSVGKEEVVRYWSLLDACVIHLKRSELFLTVIPSKLFECMGMGIPVVHGVAGESAEIVEREGVGLVFEPENSGALVERLWQLREDGRQYEEMQGRCAEAARRYDRAALAGRMLAVLADTAGRGGESR